MAAPWLGAAGLLVSFTAEANQELPSGASRRGASLHAAVMPEEFAPLPGVFGESGPSSGRGLLREARLYSGAPASYPDAPDEMQPRADLKKNARIFPEIDRSHKGDPLVGLRPSMDGRLRQNNGLARVRAELLAFTSDRSGLASSFVPAEGPPPGPDSVETFEPWGAGENPVTPSQDAGGSSTMRPAAIAEREAQGATPAPSRAESLASATPFDAEDTPVEVLAEAINPRLVGGALSSPSLATPENARDIMAMIAPQKLEAEKHCLAQAIYFEARGEPEAGQAAVAQVVLNRMTSGLYPSSICGVVFQNRSHYKACQFSFACEGRSLHVRDADSWAQAQRIADDALAGRGWLAEVGNSTHYHANYVRPRWARSLKKMDVIGKHIFYRLRSGQS
ncbi:hypothetical protein GGD83_001163 [Rhodoblastus sphagnicola]|uniref:cell wall hydrolase n=1 Tax=Rhodoblastus sphagnicola TaxID=333368 RepID=UPI00184444E9|nr:cell wall hydrolase [Rhodoblastus sphagnicola]MBB4197377.1 hypothetical protein [Rhodoblastus sphagnicola]